MSEPRVRAASSQGFASPSDGAERAARGEERALREALAPGFETTVEHG